MAEAGHPVLGDKAYGRPPKGLRALAAQIGRQALHAKRLAFRHPRTGELVDREAPRPADMEALVVALRNGLASRE
jgi:23S rRNA pseudouridine1911/1915/1917 synthase